MSKVKFTTSIDEDMLKDIKKYCIEYGLGVNELFQYLWDTYGSKIDIDDMSNYFKRAMK